MPGRHEQGRRSWLRRCLPRLLPWPSAGASARLASAPPSCRRPAHATASTAPAAAGSRTNRPARPHARWSRDVAGGHIRVRLGRLTPHGSTLRSIPRGPELKLPRGSAGLPGPNVARDRPCARLPEHASGWPDAESGMTTGRRSLAVDAGYSQIAEHCRCRGRDQVMTRPQSPNGNGTARTGAASARTGRVTSRTGPLSSKNHPARRTLARWS